MLKRPLVLLWTLLRGVNAGLHATDLIMYPGYAGNLEVNGTALVGHVGTSVVLWYTFEGLDARCNGQSNGKANTCGIHIHEGTTCDVAPAVGGHFFDGTTDPWVHVTYRVAEPMASDEDVVVAAGTSIRDNTGRTLVVHDSTGMRVACALLKPLGPGLQASKFYPYLGYTGNLSVSGVVNIQPLDNLLVVSYELTGTDPLCTEIIEGLANACGVHIHSGLACEEAGGHYYNVSVDPWVEVTYQTVGKATASNVVVTTGKTQADNNGRALVVHDVDGNRIACATLDEDVSEPHATVQISIARYPDYIGPFAVTGTVEISQVESALGSCCPAQVLTYTLFGVDESCVANRQFGAANACGIHIYNNPCESASVVDEHFFKSSSDPWTNIIYIVGDGPDADGISVQVLTNATMVDFARRSVVVHDVTGDRIACGTIVTKTTTTTVNERGTVSMSGVMRTLTTSAFAAFTLASLPAMV